MKPETIINEIERISKIKDPEECQEEIIKLYELIKAPRIKKVKRGNYYYIYAVLEYRYDKGIRHSRENKREKLGRISLQEYETNTNEVEKFIESRNQEKLKKYLEQY